jgi:methyltransferase (TIGR00027 family)
MRPDRLFEDPWAGLLAGEEGRTFLERQDEALFPTPIFVVRHRFFDDFVLEATQQGIRQVVLVAAGLDTRAYRLNWPSRTVVFEIDQVQVLAYKQTVLDQAGASPACKRVVVPVDLREDWPAELSSCGFRPTSATVWLAEGLLFYLPEDAVRSLLRTMAALSGSGSLLGTDTMSAAMLSSDERREWTQFFTDAGAPFVFGTDEPAEFVAACGWRPSVHLARDIGERLGRLLPSPTVPGPPAGAIITAALP